MSYNNVNSYVTNYYTVDFHVTYCCRTSCNNVNRCVTSYCTINCYVTNEPDSGTLMSNSGPHKFTTFGSLYFNHVIL